VTVRPLRLPRPDAEAIIAHARAEYPRECCGLLAGVEGAVVKRYTITNVYADNDFFEMESHEQATALDEIWEQRGWDLLAIYHSHPDSVAYPSVRDMGIALWPDSTDPVYPGTYYIICSLEWKEAPVLRAFLFDGGRVIEAPVIVEDDPRAALVGAWELVDWRLIEADGAAVQPFGPSPTGRLIYAADGQMSVVITAAGRPSLPDDPAKRAPAEQAAAFAGVHAYAGEWALLPGEIVHYVSASALPNYEGTEQRRRYRLEGDTLTLTTPPGRAAHLAPGSATVGQLTWRRLRGSAPPRAARSRPSGA
jgi:proteasome lid subunit RPN8/RPN11